MSITVTFDNITASDATHLMCFCELIKAEKGDRNWAEPLLFDALLSVFIGLENSWGTTREKYHQLSLADLQEYPEDQRIRIDCIWKIVTGDYPELREMIQQLHKLEYVRPAE